MSQLRNLLIALGTFWLSLWVARWLEGPLGSLNDGIVYGAGLLSAVAMGFVSSLARTAAAALAGTLVSFAVDGRQYAWALVVAVLYVVDAPVRHHWGDPATLWDRVSQGVDLLFPAVVCVLAAVVTISLVRKAPTRISA